MQDQQVRFPTMERGTFGMPKPRGWPIERIVSIMAGAVVLASLTLGRHHSNNWRILTGFVGANLMFNALAGWCPMSVILYRLGIPTAAEHQRCRGGS